MFEYGIYFISLLTFFTVVFKVLRSINIENIFKKNHVFQIKLTYILISLVIAHIIAEIILKFYGWAVLVFQT